MEQKTEIIDRSHCPDISEVGHPFAKPCMMTIFMHDYAQPPSSRQDFLFFSMEGKPPRPVPLQIFQVITMGHVRTCSNEQLGQIVRDMLNKLEDSKRQIETRKS